MLDDDRLEEIAWDVADMMLDPDYPERSVTEYLKIMADNYGAHTADLIYLTALKFRHQAQDLVKRITRC